MAVVVTSALGAQSTPPHAAAACVTIPDGAGLPENATLAGLPADYIARQVAAF